MEQQSHTSGAAAAAAAAAVRAANLRVKTEPSIEFFSTPSASRDRVLPNRAEPPVALSRPAPVSLNDAAPARRAQPERNESLVSRPCPRRQPSNTPRQNQRDDAASASGTDGPNLATPIRKLYIHNKRDRGRPASAGQTQPSNTSTANVTRNPFKKSTPSRARPPRTQSPIHPTQQSKMLHVRSPKSVQRGQNAIEVPAFRDLPDFVLAQSVREEWPADVQRAFLAGWNACLRNRPFSVNRSQSVGPPLIPTTTPEPIQIPGGAAVRHDAISSFSSSSVVAERRRTRKASRHEDLRQPPATASLSRNGVSRDAVPRTKAELRSEGGSTKPKYLRLSSYHPHSEGRDENPVAKRRVGAGSNEPPGLKRTRRVPAQMDVQMILEKYGAVIIEREKETRKVAWLACKFCAIKTGTDSRMVALKLFRAPFSSSTFEAHLFRTHGDVWRDYSRMSLKQKRKFFEGKKMPGPKAFREVLMAENQKGIAARELSV